MDTTLFGKDVKHSEMFSLLKNLNIDDEKDINILLLGETGIGKSTFVNAFVNYLSYKKLKDAENGKLIVLIPATFTIRDKSLEIQSTKTARSDDNEYLQVGSSATQDVKTYVFPIGSGKTKLRIIDSPGIGDTGGLEQDRINCDRILTYLGGLEQLHAICCMFSTSNSRIHVFFDYCLKEILSRLHTSASNNLIFVFTNSRAANFTPGDTFGILRKIVDDIQKNSPGIKIPLDSKNCFCFENDNFKYLAAKENKVEFDDSERKTYNKSWKQSSMECMRMIHYIVGDGSTRALPPHDIRNTVSINEARRLIVNLSMPLADISQMIQDNIFILDRHQQSLQSHSQSIDEMRKKLFIPVVDLEVTKLSRPSTVCAASKCATLYPVGSLQKWHYKQRCHEPCYLTNVPEKTIGSPELKDCAAMDATKQCKECGCDFSVHMHVYYLTKTKDSTIEDGAIKNTMLSREQAAKRIKDFIAKTETRRKQFEEERETVTKYMAQFAHFLQNNAIIKYNDAYENYIKYMIEREKSLGPLTDLRTIKQFEQLIKQYQEAKNAFDEALKFCAKHDLKDEVVTADTVIKSTEALYRLPHTGKKIKELVMCQAKAQSNEYKQTEYHHNHHSNIFSEDTDSGEASNEKGSGNRSRTVTRGQHNSRGRSRPPRQNFNYNSFNANKQGHPQENRSSQPPSYGSLYSAPRQYPYGHHNSSTMQGQHHPYNPGTQGYPNTHHPYNPGTQGYTNTHHPYNPGTQGYPNTHQRPDVEINISQNVPSTCTDLNCRDPACARNLNMSRGCGNPNCRDPSCQSPYPNSNYQGMSQEQYGYNYPPMNNVGANSGPYSSGYPHHDMYPNQQNSNHNPHYQSRHGQNHGTPSGRRGYGFQQRGIHRSRTRNQKSGKGSSKSAYSDSE